MPPVLGGCDSLKHTSRKQKGIFPVSTQSHSPARLAVTFDDDHAVAGAGLALIATLSERLGVVNLANEVIDLGERPGHALPGRKVATLVHGMVAGADCIDDCDVLRSGATGWSSGTGSWRHPPSARSCGRSPSVTSASSTDLSEDCLTRAWAMGAGPGDDPMIIDMDSTIVEVHGKQKQGAAYGYTHVLGHHPLVATRADTGEVLHLRHRKGSANTGRGAPRFVGRAVRPGAPGRGDRTAHLAGRTRGSGRSR